MLDLSTHTLSSSALLSSDRLLDAYLTHVLDVTLPVKWSTQYRLALQDF